MRTLVLIFLVLLTVRGDKLASAYHVENWVCEIQQIQR